MADVDVMVANGHTNETTIDEKEASVEAQENEAENKFQQAIAAWRSKLSAVGCGIQLAN